MRKIEFICSLPSKGIIGGETIKNQNLYNYFLEKKIKFNLIDFQILKNKNLKLIFLILKSFLNFATKDIYVSKSSYSAYRYFKIAKFLNIFNKKITYFVIGGRLDKIIKEEKFDLNIYKKISKIYVETKKLKENLNSLGLYNVEVLSNFKKLKKRSFIEKEYTTPLKSIFFARITPEKGTDMIFEMLNVLNKERKKIEVDFYGPISNEYEMEFRKKILENTSVKYRGVLNGQNESVYDILEKYDIMLFPTFWEGEGFPGTIIDSCIAGLPIVASNWNFNSEIIREKETGFLFEAKNQKSFNDIIYGILKEPNQLKIMRKNCYEESDKYNIDKVLENIFK